MNRMTLFFKSTFGRLWKEDMQTVRMQTLLNNVIHSDMFARMSPQEKLMSLCRIIEIFRYDYGFTPKAFERRVRSLKKKLDKDMAQLWQESYTEYFKTHPAEENHKIQAPNHK